MWLDGDVVCAYRCTCCRVYMYNTLDIGPCSIDGRVEHEAGLIDSQVGASSVYDLTLKVYLYLKVIQCQRLIKAVFFHTIYLRKSKSKVVET